MPRTLRSGAAIYILTLFLLRTTTATTLVVFYDPINGVILAEDSSIISGHPLDIRHKIRRGEAVKATTECKIHTCGKYIVASAGIWGNRSDRDLTLACKDIARKSSNIDDFRVPFELQYVNEANRYANDLINGKEPPKVNEIMFSLAIAGFENEKAVLRYRVLRYMGVVGGKTQFKITETLTCPGDAECREVRKVTGLFEDIESAQKEGKYPQTPDPFRLAEQLVQIEIKAHHKTHFVLPPISVVQVNGPIAKWFRGGLCKATK